MQNRVIQILIITVLATLFFPRKGMALDLHIDDIGLSLDAASLVEKPDSITVPDEIAHDWKTLLIQRRLDVNDTSVRYPKFIEFCLGIYRWAEKTFNTYDPAWVTGTGKHGKVRLVSDNWSDIYDFKFEKTPLVMASNLYCNLGVQANYSILSLSYSVDMNSVFTNRVSKHKKLGVSFSCARLYAEAYYWKNKGGTVIRHVGNSNIGDYNNVPFDGLYFRAMGLLGFYIFNSKRFSFAAPYNLSNYQLRSAGSWIAGLTGTFYNTDFDFTKLPPEIADKTLYPFDKYSLDYNSVNLLGGYSYNWVCNKHFLLNNTTLPGIGVSFSFSDSSPGRKDLFSATIRQMLSLTYMNRQFFVTANSTFHGNMLWTGDISFLTGIINFQVSTGVRF